MKKVFTVYCSPLSMRYPFTVIHDDQWLMANGKCMVNGKRKMANGAGGICG